MSFWSRSNERVYADAAAATPLSQAAKRELLRLLELFGNAGGLHKEAQVAKEEMERARKTIADAIGAHADEIIFTASGTEGNNLAITGALKPLLQKYGKVHALTCAIEHNSVLEPLRALEREGLELTILKVDSEGLVSLQELAEHIKENTVLVSVQYINSEVGTVEPIREIAREIRRARASRAQSRDSMPLYFHTDACQAPLWVDVKVEKLGVDLLTLDAQKVLGPKGVGALFVKRGVQLEPILRGGAQEQNLRAGTPNHPLVGAFAVALNEAQANAEGVAKNISLVRDYLWSEIKKALPQALLNGPALEHRAPNNINVSIPGLDAQMAVIALDVEGVAASTKSACNIGDEDPSHVIKALGTAPELAGTAIRLTVLPSATKQDARTIVKALVEVTKRYKVNYKNK